MHSKLSLIVSVIMQPSQNLSFINTTLDPNQIVLIRQYLIFCHVLYHSLWNKMLKLNAVKFIIVCDIALGQSPDNMHQQFYILSVEGVGGRVVRWCW